MREVQAQLIITLLFTGASLHFISFYGEKRGKLLFHLLCHYTVFLKEMVSRGGYFFWKAYKINFQWKRVLVSMK